MSLKAKPGLGVPQAQRSTFLGGELSADKLYGRPGDVVGEPRVVPKEKPSLLPREGGREGT